ncbi:hypothetical protein AB0M10_03275 [Streptomyces sp. NPDC051840]|uniref:hypothetical protein n=1 Tax=Streptomyces sp. NPDC051840 TaxID=3154752 RepID=UPI00343D0B46
MIGSMPPVSVHLKPKPGKQLTLADLRELVRRTKDVPDGSPVVVTADKKVVKVDHLDVEWSD